MDNLKKLFGSQKFIVGLAACVSVVCDKVFNWQLGEERILAIVGIAITFIGGRALEGYAEKRDVPPKP